MAVPVLQYGIGNSSSTTLTTAVGTGATSMVLTSDTNFGDKSGQGMIIVDEGESTEELVYSASKTGATLSTPLVNRGLEGGSAQAHAAAATVKGVLTVGMWNDLVDALIDNLLDQTAGTVKSGVVLTLPQIQDTSSDHQYIFAVNELTADRTVTLPLLTGNDEFVFADHTKTLTNKTLTAPTITSPTTTGTDTGALTVTARRITKRVTTITSHATPTVNTDNCDVVTITAQAEAITSMTTNLSGTPTNFQTLIFRILDDGTGRAITWGAKFEARGVALPTTTTATKLLTVGFIYDTVDSIWGCVAVSDEA